MSELIAALRAGARLRPDDTAAAAAMNAAADEIERLQQPPAPIRRDNVLKAADAVLALINSQPTTPTREQIAAAVYQHVVNYLRGLAVRASRGIVFEVYMANKTLVIKRGLNTESETG